MEGTGAKGEVCRKVEAIIEIARLLYKAGYSERVIQKAIIDPLIQEAEIRIVYGADTLKEGKNDNKRDS